ncbi:hypothetical protein NEMBOFW57_005105 [Staphylotrichum longicolle]|uniref:Uncharacterized protein n=1 Tax=Staphylotrichum longicolle TaxID=669026 RepID=A0AAD4EW68_9PEZI|nr:hypothetical protein NEMBOFW57_005105 [Staphylotrichum longicolle]
MSHAFLPFATVSQAGRPSLAPANPRRTANNGYRPNLAHRVTRRLASGTNRVSSVRRLSPLIRPGDSSDEGIIKIEPGATQNAEVDQLSDSEVDDDMAADHESSNGEMENDEAVDEQMVALEEAEDDNSTYEDFESESASSESSDDEILRGFRKDFSDLVAKLERNAIMIPKKNIVEKALGEYYKFGCQLNGIHDGGAAFDSLHELVGERLDDLRFEVVELQQIRDECNEVIKEMNRVISALTTVKQDLVDTGSTSMKRWNELRRMSGWSSMAASRGGNEISPDDIADVVRDFESYLKPYQRLLGMTVHLEDGLGNAIASLRDLSV